ncbi:unnamed protein product [Closterium sp. Naga37s-1]|nr:unnamed protein product [Closterium sp. Naga37s-1]
MSLLLPPVAPLSPCSFPLSFAMLLRLAPPCGASQAALSPAAERIKNHSLPHSLPSPSHIVRPPEKPCQAREQPATSAAEAGATATAAAATAADAQCSPSPDSSSRGKQPVRPFEELSAPNCTRISPFAPSHPPPPSSPHTLLTTSSAPIPSLCSHPALEAARSHPVTPPPPHPPIPSNALIPSPLIPSLCSPQALEAARSHPAFAKFLQQAILSTPLNPSRPASVPLPPFSPLSAFLPPFFPLIAPHVQKQLPLAD